MYKLVEKKSNMDKKKNLKSLEKPSLLLNNMLVFSQKNQECNESGKSPSL